MFTPEFTHAEQGEYVLVANHSLETTESAELSIKFNKARIAFASSHLPPEIRNCRLIYDIRGQSVAQHTITYVAEALSPACEIEFKI